MGGEGGDQTLPVGRFRGNSPNRDRFTAKTTLKITSQLNKEYAFGKLGCNSGRYRVIVFAVTPPIGRALPRKRPSELHPN